MCLPMLPISMINKSIYQNEIVLLPVDNMRHY